MPQAPIAIFIYNRPDHLRATLATLTACTGFADSPVIVFGDGPKRDDQWPAVDAARAVAREVLGERATYRFSPVNKGLARSIIDGVGAVVAEHGRVIVVEDDLALAPGFLNYMNTALDWYADQPHIFQVSGYAFAVPELRDSTMAVMLPWTTTWGWGTWDRAWQQLDEASTGWQQLETDAGLRRRFNLDGVYDYATLFQRQMKGLSDSWGIRWYWTVFKAGGLVVFPPQTLVRNTGMDGSGSHGRGLFRRFDGVDQADMTRAIEFPRPIVVEATRRAVVRAVWQQNGGWLGLVIDRLKKVAVSLKGR
jgi:Glycosyl transferase family 2